MAPLASMKILAIVRLICTTELLLERFSYLVTFYYVLHQSDDGSKPEPLALVPLENLERPTTRHQ
eukprot:scaffold3529_cov68-Cylindrotheca_fusiformis.AAC.2